MKAAVRNSVFTLPSSVEVSINCLLTCFDQHFAFWRNIANLNASSDGSMFCWCESYQLQKSPWADLSQRRLVLVLPYCILFPMLHQRVNRRESQQSDVKRARHSTEQSHKFSLSLEAMLTEEVTPDGLSISLFNPRASVRRQGQTNDPAGSITHFFTSWRSLVADADEMPEWWQQEVSTHSKEVAADSRFLPL